MKKATIFAVSLLILLSISMSGLLVGCNNPDKLVGSWDKDKNSSSPYIIIAKEKSNLVLKKYGSFSVDEMTITYDSKEKSYKVYAPIGADKLTWATIKVIDSNTIEIKNFGAGNDGTFYKVS